VPLVLGLAWAALPLAIVGAWVILVALGPQLEVVTSGGTRHHAGFCASHEIDAELFTAAVEDLAGRSGD
jgi:hypothetical protein